MKETIFVDSLKDVDFSEMRIPFITVYEHPSDCPGHYIGRLWGIWEGQAVPTNIAIKAKNKYAIFNIAVKAGFDRFIPRHVYEDKCIVGTLW